MIVTAHQPTFLPYSGFWYKLAKADVMDLRYRAQFVQKPGYERRVQMREHWCTLPLIGNPRFERICEVRLDGPTAVDVVRKTIIGRYASAAYFKQRGPELLDRLEPLGDCEFLWHWNLELLLAVRDMLGITTPFSLGVDTVGRKADGVLSLLRAYPQADTFLSGRGALKYMENTSIFDEAGIKVEWSRHRVTTYDSVLSVLMDHADPMDIVLMEEE
jgi:hypothetical protein